jgi:hypothetical protein
MNNELKNIQKESAVAQYKEIYRHLPGETEKTMTNVS